MGMTIDAKYTILLKLNVSTVVEDKTVISKYTPELQIDLA